MQTGKVEKYPIILFGSHFWNSVINFDTLVEWGVISPDDIKLFKIVDEVEAAANYIIERLETSEQPGQ
jgi:predicted Rossmann-fold nucleotide-binding protein